MVTHWGMSERIGPVAYRGGEEHPFLGKEFHEQREFSEHTAQVIDEEVARILRSASERAIESLTANREQLDRLAAALEEHEEIDEAHMERLFGPSASNLAKRNGQAAKKSGEKHLGKKPDEKPDEKSAPASP
jgi:cell division protease FtsH